MIERLDFGNETAYNAVEATIHLNRYAMARPYVKGKNVLDVASGEGYGSFLLKKWGAKHVEALDIDKETVKKAAHMFGSDDVHFQCHTAEELPFEDYCFDLICSFETIEHLDHPDAFLKEIKRVLKPDGMILLSCPNDPYYYKEGLPQNPFHKSQYTFFDFKNLAERYLGGHVKYYLSFALDGFVNLPFEKAMLPPEGDEPSALPGNMLELLNYDECVNALGVSAERYLNYWNSNYYVGIWGAGALDQVNAAFYPREYFVSLSDRDIEFYKEAAQQKAYVSELEEKLAQQEGRIKELLSQNEIKKLESESPDSAALLKQLEEELSKKQAQIEALQEQMDSREKDIERLEDTAKQENAALISLKEELSEKQTQIEDLQEQLNSGEKYIQYLKDTAKQEMHVAKLEQDRISMMLELATKEKECLSQNAYSNYMSFMNANYAKEEAEKREQQLQGECQATRSELQGAQWRLADVNGQLANVNRELANVNRELANVNRELELIKSSRGFKLLNLGFPIKKRIWKLFGKDI